jgi:hypothetical protein
MTANAAGSQKLDQQALEARAEQHRANTANPNSQPAGPAEKCPRVSAEGTTMSPLWILVKINQSVFTSRVLGLICDSEARTAIVSDGQHIGTSQGLQALNALRELLGIL